MTHKFGMVEGTLEKSLALAGQAPQVGSATPAISKRILTWYWVFTLWIALESLWAGVTDILHAPPLSQSCCTSVIPLT